MAVNPKPKANPMDSSAGHMHPAHELKAVSGKAPAAKGKSAMKMPKTGRSRGR